MVAEQSFYPTHTQHAYTYLKQLSTQDRYTQIHPPQTHTHFPFMYPLEGQTPWYLSHAVSV